MPRSVILIGFLLSFSMWAPVFCVPPMESVLMEDLALTHAQAGLLFSTPYFVIAAVAIPSGILADRIGLRRATGIGIILIALGSALRALADGFHPIIAFTVLYGVGFALVFTNLPKLIATWVTPEKSGVALGIINTGMSVGAAAAMGLTMSVVFPLTSGYSGTFLIWSVPAIIVAVLWWILVKEPPENTGKVTDNPGHFWRPVLRNRKLWLLAGLMALGEFFIMNWFAWHPLLLVSKGATPELAGIITSLMLWVEIPTLLIIPRLSHRLGLKKPFLWAAATATILATVGAIYVDLGSSWLPAVICGIVNVTRFIIILSMPFDLVSKEQLGAASGIILSMGYLAGGIGPFIGGRIIDATGDLDTAFRVLIWVAATATAISFLVPETGYKSKSKVSPPYPL